MKRFPVLSILIIMLTCSVNAIHFKDRYYTLALDRSNFMFDNFTIHGLWPEYSNSSTTTDEQENILKSVSWPQYCRQVKFDQTDLDPILIQLIDYWPSNSTAMNDVQFWKHEWERHGSCMFVENMTSFQYFDLTLSLYLQAKYEGMFCNTYCDACYFHIREDFTFDYMKKPRCIMY